MIDWGYLYAHIVACTGWTLQHVRWHMDLPSYAAMSRYWDAHPPLHMMVQGYLGIESRPANQRSDEKSDLEAFIASFRDAGGSCGG